MNVSEIMTHPVITVRPDTPVSEVARLLVDYDITGVPVVDDRGHLIGLVTEADLIVQHARLHFPRLIKLLESVVVLDSVDNFEEELRRALAATAGELMTRDVVTAPADADVGDVARLMFEKNVNPIPVVEGHLVVGVVSRADLVRLMVRRQTEEGE